MLGRNRLLQKEGKEETLHERGSVCALNLFPFLSFVVDVVVHLETAK